MISGGKGQPGSLYMRTDLVQPAGIVGERSNDMSPPDIKE